MSATSEGLGVKGNSLPVGQPTGKFPIAQSDPAYQFDTNPNSIKPTALNFKLPLNPLKADTPSCLSMGMIGFTLTGVPIYNALDAAGRDAVAHEVQDLCDGHPQGKGQYHYHSGSPCLPGYLSNEVVGYALDGFPIMGTTDASGKQLTNSDLDACHGQAVSITVDGRSYSYAYRMTHEYPYTIGCYVGEVSDSIKQATMGKPKGQQGMGKNANPNGGLNKAGGRQRPLNNGGRRPPKL